MMIFVLLHYEISAFNHEENDTDVFLPTKSIQNLEPILSAYGSNLANYLTIQAA